MLNKLGSSESSRAQDALDKLNPISGKIASVSVPTLATAAKLDVDSALNAIATFEGDMNKAMSDYPALKTELGNKIDELNKKRNDKGDQIEDYKTQAEALKSKYQKLNTDHAVNVDTQTVWCDSLIAELNASKFELPVLLDPNTVTEADIDGFETARAKSIKGKYSDLANRDKVIDLHEGYIKMQKQIKDHVDAINELKTEEETVQVLKGAGDNSKVQWCLDLVAELDPTKLGLPPNIGLDDQAGGFEGSLDAVKNKLITGQLKSNLDRIASRRLTAIGLVSTLIGKVTGRKNKCSNTKSQLENAIVIISAKHKELEPHFPNDPEKEQLEDLESQSTKDAGELVLISPDDCVSKPSCSSVEQSLSELTTSIKDLEAETLKLQVVRRLSELKGHKAGAEYLLKYYKDDSYTEGTKANAISWTDGIIHKINASIIEIANIPISTTVVTFKDRFEAIDKQVTDLTTDNDKIGLDLIATGAALKVSVPEYKNKAVEDIDSMIESFNVLKKERDTSGVDITAMEQIVTKLTMLKKDVDDVPVEDTLKPAEFILSQSKLTTFSKKLKTEYAEKEKAAQQELLADKLESDIAQLDHGVKDAINRWTEYIKEYEAVEVTHLTPSFQDDIKQLGDIVAALGAVTKPSVDASSNSPVADSEVTAYYSLYHENRRRLQQDFIHKEERQQGIKENLVDYRIIYELSQSTISNVTFEEYDYEPEPVSEYPDDVIDPLKKLQDEEAAKKKAAEEEAKKKAAEEEAKKKAAEAEAKKKAEEEAAARLQEGDVIDLSDESSANTITGPVLGRILTSVLCALLYVV